MLTGIAALPLDRFRQAAVARRSRLQAKLSLRTGS
jgi:hypothetical protein